MIFSSILEALNLHATATPDKVVFTWVNKKCEEQNKMTFKQLEDQSNAVAARLLKLGCKKGDRVMIAYPFGLEFLAGMFGAMKIGLKTDMPKFRGFAKDAGAKYALTTKAFATAMTAASVLYKTGVKWIGTDTLPIKKGNPNKPKGYETYNGEPEEVCFIQYTSGSTGRPKGVMISHRSLAENCIAISAMSGTNASNVDTTVGALWVPQYHDMGLVAGFMTTLYAGSSLVMASPLDFVVNPLLWSDMVETYKATLTCAPNFAYALLLKRLQQANRTADWSCVRRAMFGGEPAQSHVLAAVAKTLSIKPEHIYNIYGMAESVVFLTGGPANPDFEELVSCGVVDSPTIKLRIVQDGIEVLDGQVGTIWAQSPRVTAGYYGQPKLTTSNFANSLPGYDGMWLDTGDLGKILDGQLYVTGRVKDVIIINGKNYYPTDVELSIDETFGGVIRPGRTTAFQLGDASVGITVEGRKGFDKSENEDLAVQIANHVSQFHGLFASEVVVLKLGVTPKTTSGKLKRSEIRQTTIAGDWKEACVLLHYQRNEFVDPLAKGQRSSFLGISFAMNGVASREFYLNEDTGHEMIRESVSVAVVGVFGHERNPAFGMFLGSAWPNLMALARELDVDPVPMATAQEVRDVVGMGTGMIPEANPAEILRFLAEMNLVYKSGTGQSETIGQYMARNGFDHHFVVSYFLGRMISFFAGNSIQQYLDYPLDLIAWYVAAMVISPADEVLFRMRNKEYMAAFERRLLSLGVEFKLGCSPIIIGRDKGVSILTGVGDDDILRFDKLVLAVPPNAALQVLGEHCSDYEGVLVDFECPLETVVYHTDPKWALPSKINGVFANIPDCGASLPSLDDTIPITSSLPSDTDNKTPIYATHAYSTFNELEFASPIETMTFTHTKVTCKAILLRKSLLRHQGRHSTYFAGGWTCGLMLHEDALVSGIQVANTILHELGGMSHAILKRTIAHGAFGGDSDEGGEEDELPGMQPESFTTRFAKTTTCIFGSDLDFSKTWTENGITSLKSAELRNKVEEGLLVVLPANFEQLYPTPKALSAFLATSKGESFPKQDLDNCPDFLWKSPRSNLSKVQLGVIQALGSTFILLLVFASFIPSYFLASWAIDQSSSAAEEKLHKLAFWVLLPQVLPLFFLSLSVVVVLCKLCVIGKYLPRHFELLSWDYVWWWFVDRLMEVWESLVGKFILETRYIWIFYWLLGANLAWSAKIESYIREFDLVIVGDNATIGHPLKCRKFSHSKNENPSITFRPVVVGKNSSVSGMVSPGAKIGNDSKVEKLSVVEEGAIVPDGVLARGNPACHGGSFKPQERSYCEDSVLDVFKFVWIIFEAYHFFSLSYLVHFTLNQILPSWRYATVLHWFLLFPTSSCLAFGTSIVLKWLLIGKRDPSDEYEGSLWWRATNWACDFHFSAAAWPLTAFIGHSKLWMIILSLHGLDVDIESVMNISSHTQFTPSKVDYVKIRKSFVPNIYLDLSKQANSKIEIINSSVGYYVNLHAGVKIMQSMIPPRSTVSESIYDLNTADHAWKPNLKDLLFSEFAQQLMNVIFFAALIPTYELGLLVATKSSSFVVLSFGLIVAFVLQLFLWLVMTRAVECALLSLPPYSRIQQSLYGVYINNVWFFRVQNWLVYLLYGTPMFATYARMMGSEVDGDLWYFGSTLYEYGKLHFHGCTIVDSAHVMAHYVDMKGLTINDTYISGILHPGCYASAGAVVTGSENGPWKLFLRKDDAQRSRKPSHSTMDDLEMLGSS
ncbi:7a-methyl-1,5-dioxo-octahydro-1H-inden-4-yl [Seminavis robusta]|uniref:7a-methyl-1,5-dioxo-octahydro-1H-inden-4-yl n=1 Tax=Seminavis robusta TaxID=568900 RepID=A0A9N8EV69_9STRA|nr:7a-methyl-1,5-dioxo-octahydro-1H-inden-4-yl [Seminavis robusta]|eukprot:Sro1710_g292750.1 7a-methyl-1,5-dioxo-octahydro-1H-inden-4-yl (1753) ;mRNA; r:5602-11488